MSINDGWLIAEIPNNDGWLIAETINPPWKRNLVNHQHHQEMIDPPSMIDQTIIDGDGHRLVDYTTKASEPSVISNNHYPYIARKALFNIIHRHYFEQW